MNGVVPGGVYGLGLFLGQVSSSLVGEGWAGSTGLGDLVAVHLFSINARVLTFVGLVWGAGDNGVGLS